jgi:hypothetical protein
MANNSLDFLKDVISATLGSLISSIGASVGEAQAALDAGSLAQTLAIYDKENKDELITALRSIGYQPTFYVLPETEVEANISLALSISEQNSNMLPSNNILKAKIYATPINASNSNKYNLNIAASTKLKFKIVPVPAPSDVIDIRVVPNLIDKELSEALGLLDQTGFQYEIKSETKTGKIISQNPEGGAISKLNNVIDLYL